jgi:hypothetical protein
MLELMDGRAFFRVIAGLDRRSILLADQMDARVKPVHDGNVFSSMPH